jgi:hypothetical protein
MVQASNDLAQAFETLEKIADMKDWAGKAMGTYGGYAGLTALAAGLMAYRDAEKTSRRSVLEKALKRRQTAQQQRSPSEIYALPEPVASHDSEEDRA